MLLASRAVQGSARWTRAYAYRDGDMKMVRNTVRRKASKNPFIVHVVNAHKDWQCRMTRSQCRLRKEKADAGMKRWESKDEGMPLP